MNRNKEEIKEEIVNEYVWRSMAGVPNNKIYLPLILAINLDPFYKGQEVPVSLDNTIRCKYCGAFFNPYCYIYENPTVFKCNLCNLTTPLPLPPSDSIFNGIQIAKASIPFSNAVYDIIPKQNDRNYTPRIIIVVQSAIVDLVQQYLAYIIPEESLFQYSLIIFDSTIQVYDFNAKSWKYLCCSVDEDFFMPALPDNLFGPGSVLKQILPNIPLSSNICCSTKMLYSILEQLQPAKCVLVLYGPINEWDLRPPPITFPCSILVFEPYANLINNIDHWINQITTKVYICTELTQGAIAFLQREITTPYMLDMQVSIRRNKKVEVKRVAPASFVYSVSDYYYSSNSLACFLQIEYIIIDMFGVDKRRFVNIKIPISSDPRIYKSVTFPNPIDQIMPAAKYIIEKIRDMVLQRDPTFKIRNVIADLSYEYPIESFWQQFVYFLLKSEILSDQISEDDQKTILNSFISLPPPIIFLHFLPLDYSNNRIDAAKPLPHLNADALITKDCIYALPSTSEEIIQNIYSSLRIDQSWLPIVRTETLPFFQDDNKDFTSWSNNFDLTRFTHLNELKKKKYPERDYDF